MQDNEYQCSACGGVFEKGWSDEEALVELQENFAEEREMGMSFSVVCDDCHKQFMRWLSSPAGVRAKKQMRSKFKKSH